MIPCAALEPCATHGWPRLLATGVAVRRSVAEVIGSVILSRLQATGATRISQRRSQSERLHGFINETGLRPPRVTLHWQNLHARPCSGPVRILE